MRILMAMIIAAGLAAPAVSAQSGDQQARVVVKTNDLDLSAQAGQRALNRRVFIAVGRLCGYPASFTRAEEKALAACQSGAMHAMAAQIKAARQRMTITVAANR